MGQWLMVPSSVREKSPSSKATSVDVPPISKLIILSIPHCLDMFLIADRPPAGPERRRFTARCAACEISIVPPLDCITEMGHPSSCSISVFIYWFTFGPRLAFSHVAMPLSYSLYLGSTNDDRDVKYFSSRASSSLTSSFGSMNENKRLMATASGDNASIFSIN